MNQLRNFAWVFWLVLAFGAHSAQAAKAQLISNPAEPREAFAAAEVEAALRSQSLSVRREDSRAANNPQWRGGRIMVIFGAPQSLPEPRARLHRVDPSTIAREGFQIRRFDRKETTLYYVISRDTAGALYGGLELAEQIRTLGATKVVNTDRNPHMPLRGTKFNIPLDLRTPSYSDMGDSAQENIATVWDLEFWREYLDGLARQRYNFVSLWNLHPFPSMVKVPEFPDVALNDIWRTRAKLAEDYSTRTTDLLNAAMLANKEVVKTLTIDEKIAFWRRVMEYGRDRNIQFNVITWNIFTYGVDGKYGITDALENPKTVEYFRASVREMFRTYPLLAGIGLTAGENMGEVKMYSGGVDSFNAKENWLFATYGQGVLDAARAEPGRQFRLIHRQHETGARDIAATFKPVIEHPNVDFVFSFKYAQAHALSSTTQTYHPGFVESLGDLKTLWTIRNDDALMFRWAAPDFVREFVSKIPREPSAGYYVGSDMWVWGRDYLSKSAKSKKPVPRQLENDKHWLHFLLWGRFAYDPTVDNARIGALVAQRFPGVDGAALLTAWQDASMIYPLVTGFHWADFDFQWYIEACRSRPAPARTASGFHSVETFITQKVHPGTDNIPIPKYVESIAKNPGATLPGTTPPRVAALIDASADASLAALGQMKLSSDARRNSELTATLEDIRAMALLGKYYAAKIRGATALAMFRASRAAAHQQEAVRELSAAQGYWLDYTSRTGARYRNPIWTNRVGHVDWTELNAEVAADITWARAPLR
jgi:hypothetical protein